ncbi:hypothetical protein [Sanguibacter sp. HDW7]|uniref:hypothetical protein n=1 Tax=Sanguibacter sp. HDW7 TaxID=2714931 RepID=UPI00140AA190|nr:hypothetical protein [Sanguibacter sp. HDW7]QIK83121.1 hypothetical protein G7063_05365 [Sanguibacter sp. HDW7]
MTTTDLDERTALSDRAVALLRTAVPGLWAALVTTLLRIISPHLPGDVGTALAALLRSELVVTFVVVLVLALWYWLWRRVEQLVPDGLVRLALGSARTPGYTQPVELGQTPDGAHVVTTLTSGEAALIVDVREVEALAPIRPEDAPDPDDDVDEVVID